MTPTREIPPPAARGSDATIIGRTIVCFASGYDAPPTSKHHVMHLLAEHNVVLWVNYHASRAPSASSADLRSMVSKLAQVARGLHKVRANLYVLTPLVVPLPSSSGARKLNRALLISQLRTALARVGDGPVQVWSFTPDVAYAMGHFQIERTVYYCVDDHASFSGYDREQVLRDEAELCRRSDLVVTTSMALQEAKKPLARRCVLVPHGVDYEHFARATTNGLVEPDDLADIPRPRLGFFGLIRDWVDLDLLAEVARRRPDWHVVLLGDSTIDLSTYRSIPNLHFLGRKPYEQLPAYCRHFDVGLIPFRVNELTRAVNPIKLREYLAAGLPVVSSPLPEVRLYERLIEIAASPEEFVAGVERALGEGPARRSERRDAMSGETWPAKVERISRELTAAGSDGGLP